VRRALVLAALAGLGLAASCSSPEEQKAAVESQAASEKQRQREKPYVTLFDSLDKSYFPSGTFEPGFTTVLAPIHSGIHTTLFFLATRGTIPLHIHKAHEESLFILSGSGSVLLPGGKTLPIEAGYMVRIPPGVCHGFAGNDTDPLKGIIVVSPTVEDGDSFAATEDTKGILGSVWCVDVSSTAVLPALQPQPESQKVRRILQETKYSTVQVSAVRRDKIPEHSHKDHDETVIIFALAGYGFQRLDEVVDPVQSGQIIHIPAGTVHSFEHQAEGHARAVSIFTPGYDGTDIVGFVEKKGYTAPPGYKVTDRNGDYLETGQHADGLWLTPHARERIEVGPGEDKSPR
jgi:quercetin dioxygenase-like cupin family protein